MPASALHLRQPKPLPRPRSHVLHSYDHDPSSHHFGDEGAAKQVRPSIMLKTLVVSWSPRASTVAVVPVSRLLDLKASRRCEKSLWLTSGSRARHGVSSREFLPWGGMAAHRHRRVGARAAAGAGSGGVEVCRWVSPSGLVTSPNERQKSPANANPGHLGSCRSAR